MNCGIPFVFDVVRLSGTLHIKALVGLETFLLSTSAKRRRAERLDPDCPLKRHQLNEQRDPGAPSFVLRQRRHDFDRSFVVGHPDMPVADFLQQPLIKLPGYIVEHDMLLIVERRDLFHSESNSEDYTVNPATSSSSSSPADTSR